MRPHIFRPHNQSFASDTVEEKAKDIEVLFDVVAGPYAGKTFSLKPQLVSASLHLFLCDLIFPDFALCRQKREYRSSGGLLAKSLGKTESACQTTVRSPPHTQRSTSRTARCTSRMLEVPTDHWSTGTLFLHFMSNWASAQCRVVSWDCSEEAEEGDEHEIENGTRLQLGATVANMRVLNN